jgi:hypothetical protein
MQFEQDRGPQELLKPHIENNPPLTIPEADFELLFEEENPGFDTVSEKVAYFQDIESRKELSTPTVSQVSSILYETNYPPKKNSLQASRLSGLKDRLAEASFDRSSVHSRQQAPEKLGRLVNNCKPQGTASSRIENQPLQSVTCKTQPRLIQTQFKNESFYNKSEKPSKTNLMNSPSISQIDMKSQRSERADSLDKNIGPIIRQKFSKPVQFYPGNLRNYEIPNPTEFLKKSKPAELYSSTNIQVLSARKLQDSQSRCKPLRSILTAQPKNNNPKPAKEEISKSTRNRACHLFDSSSTQSYGNKSTCFTPEDILSKATNSKILWTDLQSEIANLSIGVLSSSRRNGDRQVLVIKNPNSDDLDKLLKNFF